MNDKDKEAFEKWYSKEASEVLWEEFNGDEIVIKAWQAACEYKDKSLINGTRMKQMNEENERLKAENAKLRECVEFYAENKKYHGYSSNKSGEYEYYHGAIIDDSGKLARSTKQEVSDMIKRLGGEG